MKKFHLTLRKKLLKSETLNNNFENLKTASFGRWFLFYGIIVFIKITISSGNIFYRKYDIILL